MKQPTLRHLHAAWRDAARAELARSTIKTWYAAIRAFLDWLEKDTSLAACPHEFNRAVLKQYLHYLRTRPTADGGKGLRPRTIRSHFSALIAFGHFLGENGHLTENPALSIDLPPLDAPVRLTLSESDAKDLLTACERLTPPGRRTLAQAVLSVFLSTLVRRKEFFDLKVGDVDFTGHWLTVRHGKGDKFRRVPLPAETEGFLKAWLRVRAGMNCKHDWLWAITINRRMGPAFFDDLRDQLKAIAGLSPEARVVPHALRRAGATHQLRRGIDIKTIQANLGHAHAQTTILYLFSDAERQQECREAQAWLSEPVKEEPAKKEARRRVALRRTV